MESPRKATVRLVEETTATARVQTVFNDIRQTKQIDFVPDLWQALAINPDLLEVTWAHLKQVMHPEATGKKTRLDARTREIIALAVSATNGCSYCVNSHTAALRKQGMDDETLGEVMSVVALFNSTNALADGFQVQADVLPPLEQAN